MLIDRFLFSVQPSARALRMQMIDKVQASQPGTCTSSLFAVGIAIMMFSLTISIQPVWDTFMLPWRIEILASTLLLGFLIFGVSRIGVRSLVIERPEWWFIIVPITSFVLWSALSMLWSNSPRSAAHHTLVWAIYLGFFICFRLILDHRGSYSKLISAFSFPLLFFASLAILGYFTILIVGRGSALGIIYSKWGEQVNALLPLLLIAVLGAKGKRFYLFAGGLTLLWLMVYVSASRTAIGLFVIGFIIVSLIVLGLRRFQRFRLKIGILAGAILSTTLLLSAIPGIFSHASSPTVSRFSDTAHLGGSNDFRKLMISLGLEMVAERPVTGVGADNFGFEVNRYRAAYSAENPDDPTLSQAEMSIPERAHNEYLQIASELGLVGVALFAWFLIGVAWSCTQAIKQHKSIPPQAIAASVGLVLFLLSSLVTSYSFRLVQNGLVFFFVLAVLRRTAKKSSGPLPLSTITFPFKPFRVAGALACIALIALCGARVASVAIAKAGHTEPDIEAARQIYDRARRLDAENPEPAYYLGIRLLKERRYEESAAHLKKSIRIGKAPSVDYSYLATAQFLAGENVAAEETLAEAAMLYPRSVFVLARYSVILSMNGKPEKSIEIADRARSVDAVSANTWLALIEYGPKKASELAFQDTSYKAVMDLEPYDCIYALITERDIRFPEERIKFPFDLAGIKNSGD